MGVSKFKPPQWSRTLEKMNEELRKECAETAESSRRAIETSKKLAKQTHDLVARVRGKRNIAS